MARAWLKDGSGHDHGHGHDHSHTSELECLSVTLRSARPDASVDLNKLEKLLQSAPKDEVYRIKAVLYSKGSPKATDGTEVNGSKSGRSRYILNWSFGRWTWSHDDVEDANAPPLRMSIFTAQYESNKWTKKIETGNFISLDSEAIESALEVKRVQ